MTNTYPDFLYRDPLLLPTKLNNQRSGTPLIFHNIIDENEFGDPFLHSFISRLNKEVYSQIPDGLDTMAEAFWINDEWNVLMTQIANECRKHGWCVVNFYNQPFNGRLWKVFSVQQFSDYIKTMDKQTGKLEVTGMKFDWGDYLGNTWHEELEFDTDTFLIKWEDGNDHTFALPDLSQDIMTLAFNLRQINGQMTASASKPSYQHFKYGEDADDESIDNLDSKIRYVDSMSAIGAPIGVLQEIDVIENKNIDIIDPSFERQLKLFAGATRLPISFYLGEKENNGISDIGTKMDEVKVMKKKEEIFNVLQPYIERIFREHYGIETEIEYPQDEVVMEDVEENEARTETEIER